MIRVPSVQMRRTAGLLLLLLFYLCCGHVHAGYSLVLWDSAVIRRPEKLNETKLVELVYSTDPLAEGQLITTFVPLGTSYRVMCCLKIKSSHGLSLKDLIKTYQYDPDFVARVRALKGVSYVYAAEFLEQGQLNKHMKEIASAAGETYYSAVGLLGMSSVDRIKGLKFHWHEYGLVSIEAIEIGRNRFSHQLKSSMGTVSIEEPGLPD